MASEIKVVINAKGVVTGGKEVESGLQRIRQEAKQTQSELKKAVNVDVKASSPQLDSFASSLKNISGGLGLIGKAGLAGLVIKKTIGFMLDAADASERMSNSLLGLQTVSKATGNDLDAVTRAAKELSSDGLAPIGDVASGLKNLLAKGFSLPEAIKLLKVTKDSAAFGRQEMLTFGDAIRGVTEGIKNENSMMTDNGGITTNLSIMYKEYADKIGLAVTSLSAAQKRQAILNGFMKEGEKTSGDAARAADTYTGAKAKLATAIERATAKLGDFITKSSLVKGVLSGLAEYIDNLSFSSLTAAEKLKILQGDLANFRPGLDFNAKERKQALIEEIASLTDLAELDELRSAQGQYEAKLVREKIELKQKEADAAMKAADAEKKRLKEVATLKKQLIDAGKSEIDQLKDLRDRRLALAKGDAEARVLIEKDYQEKKAKLEEKGVKASTKLAKDSMKEIIDMQKSARLVLTEFAQNPIGGSNSLRDLKSARAELIAQKGDDESEELHEKIKVLDKKISAGENSRSLGVGVGLANAVVGGAKGAQGLVSGVAAAGLDMLAPGLGEAAKPLLDAFAQGPDAVKSMVTEFAEALPDVITGFVKAIPVFIETLVDKTPEIIERLAEGAPDVMAKLVESAPRIAIKLMTMMPKVAFQFASELIKNLPRIVGEAARAIYEAVSKALSQISGGAKSGINSVTKFVGIKFARGGEVPGSAGTPFTDSVNAQLMPSERVLDRGTNAAFKRFVDSGMSGNNDVLLARVIELLEAPLEVMSTAKVHDKAFADIALRLFRQNQRTS